MNTVEWTLNDIETVKHFFLECPIYNNQMITLVKTVSRFCAVTLDTLLFGNVFRVILVEIRLKYARIRPLPLFFTYFCRYSLFYIFRARGRDRKISAPYQPST